MMFIEQALAAEICAELATPCFFVPFEVCGEAPQTAHSLHRLSMSFRPAGPFKSYAGLANSLVLQKLGIAEV